MSTGYRIASIANAGTVSVNVGNADGGITATLTPTEARELGEALVKSAGRAELLLAEANEIAEATDRIRAKYRGEKVA